MPDYTFETMSPYDLEVLARDLLQAELGLRLEHFARGRDRGIDLRCATALSANISETLTPREFSVEGGGGIDHADDR